MPAFDFVRLGIPCTVQTRNKSRLDNYRRDVRRIARFRWPGDAAALAVAVSVSLNYYYTVDVLDVDNIIKPVLDELKGLVYRDDIQVVRVVSQKQSVLLSGALPMSTRTLSDGLRSRSDFLYILVEWDE